MASPTLWTLRRATVQPPDIGQPVPLCVPSYTPPAPTPFLNPYPEYHELLLVLEGGIRVLGWCG